MQNIRIIALATTVAEEVRATMKAPGYGHPAYKEMAKGTGPCRHCLQWTKVGEEERILFTYDPFSEVGTRSLPGPIFVHAEPCERHGERAGFPDNLRQLRLTLIAFGADRQVKVEEQVWDGKVEATAERMFARRDVEYLHVRFTEPGCYGLRI